MASKFVGVRFSQALRASLSIYVVFFATIAAAIFLPDFVLWLPKHIFPESVGCFKNRSVPAISALDALHPTVPSAARR